MKKPVVMKGIAGKIWIVRRNVSVGERAGDSHIAEEVRIKISTVCISLLCFGAYPCERNRDNRENDKQPHKQDRCILPCPFRFLISRFLEEAQAAQNDGCRDINSQSYQADPENCAGQG